MLTERRQQQAIVDLIHGLAPELDYAKLAKPYRRLWQEIQDCLDHGYNRHDIQQELYRLKLSESGEKLAEVIDAVLVAEDEGYIVGFLHLAVEDEEGTGWTRNLVVTPRLRRRGIGTALMQAAADWLRRRNVNRVLLEMTTKNYPAIRFAQKLGFSFCGYNDRYYTNQDIAIFFAKVLR